MSLTASRTYLRARAEAIGLKEWKDGFNFSNIPSNLIDRSYHIESNQAVGVKLNMSDQELNFAHTVRIFVKGFRNSAQGIDTAIEIAQTYIKECVTATNRVAQTNGIKNVVFENVNFDAQDTSNDNLIVASLTFRIFSVLAVQGDKMGTVANQKVEPMTVTFGEDVLQSENITCVADVASSLNSKYFLFYTPGGVKHYAWYDVNSAGTDPAVSGGTAHEINLGVADSAAAVATATAAVLTAVTGFDCTADGAVLTLVGTVAGYAKPAHDGAAACGFTFEVNNYGDTAVDLGFTDGDIEISHEENYVDVTSHQTGTQVLSAIHTGNTMSVSVSLKETAVSQLRKILATAEGDAMIPDGTGVSSTEVLGYGTSRQFKQTLGRARKLVLHPVVLPSSNLSRDVTIWKAYPKISSLTYSGENIQMIPVEFAIYPDYTKQDKVRMCTFGDSTQTLT